MTEKEEKNPWRFYQAEHLWKKMAEALESKEVAEQQSYLYKKVINLFLERDDLMQLLHESKSDKIKKAMLTNLAAVNEQIDSLLIYLQEEENGRTEGSLEDDREPSPGGMGDGGAESV